MRLISQSIRRFSNRLASIQPIPSAEFEQRRQRLVKRCRNATGNDKGGKIIIMWKIAIASSRRSLCDSSERRWEKLLCP